MQHSFSNHTLTQYEQRALALAAIVQSARLVDQIAQKGLYDVDDFQATIASLFTHDSPDHNQHKPLGMFESIDNLKTGLRITHQILGGHQLDRAKPILTYTSALMVLEKKLRNEPDVLQKLGEHMERIHRQIDYFGHPTHENIIASIAHAYGETVSTLKPRIIVKGKTEHLSQSHQTQRVRALLLAGIRAAHAWHQAGGRNIHLLFRRKHLAQTCQHFLSQVPTRQD